MERQQHLNRPLCRKEIGESIYFPQAKNIGFFEI